MARRAYKRTPLAVRFARYVDQRGPAECWPWTGNRDRNGGYGRIHGGGRGAPTFRAHRVAWELAHGQPVPQGKVVVHTCTGDAGCVNPAHLILTDRATATARAHHRGRMTRARGDRNPRTRISDATVREMRRLRAEEGWTAAEIAEEFGAGKSTVESILSHRTRRFAGGPVTRGIKKGPRRARRDLPPYLVEQACAMRDEGYSWPQITAKLKRRRSLLADAVRERDPELEDMSAIELARRHRQREARWADLLRQFPPDDEAEEMIRELQRSSHQPGRVAAAA